MPHFNYNWNVRVCLMRDIIAIGEGLLRLACIIRLAGTRSAVRLTADKNMHKRGFLGIAMRLSVNRYDIDCWIVGCSQHFEMLAFIFYLYFIMYYFIMKKRRHQVLFYFSIPNVFVYNFWEHFTNCHCTCLLPLHQY